MCASNHFRNRIKFRNFSDQSSHTPALCTHAQQCIHNLTACPSPRKQSTQATLNFDFNGRKSHFISDSFSFRTTRTTTVHGKTFRTALAANIHTNMHTNIYGFIHLQAAGGGGKWVRFPVHKFPIFPYEINTHNVSPSQVLRQTFAPTFRRTKSKFKQLCSPQAILSVYALEHFGPACPTPLSYKCGCMSVEVSVVFKPFTNIFLSLPFPTFSFVAGSFLQLCVCSRIYFTLLFSSCGFVCFLSCRSLANWLADGLWLL